MLKVGQDNTSTHKFVVFNALGNVWNGTGYVPWVDANFTTYGISANRIGTSTNYYAADVPGAVHEQLWLWTGVLSTSYQTDVTKNDPRPIVQTQSFFNDTQVD
jgi:hypothetical protein